MQSALISAAVAALVTLGLEFFAKPSLEARKERILERHRHARAIEDAFMSAGLAASEYASVVRSSRDTDLGVRIAAVPKLGAKEEALRVALDNLHTATIAGQKAALRPDQFEALEEFDIWRSTWMTMTAMIEGPIETASIAGQIAAAAVDTRRRLEAPWWRWRIDRWRRRRAAKSTD